LGDTRKVIHHSSDPLRKGFDAADATTYAVTRMSSTARTERIFARSTLSGRPVGLPPISLDLLGLLLAR
jgi:hypothetical protein